MVGQDGPVTESEKAGLVDDPATLCGGAGETVPTHVPQAPGVCALSVIAPGSLFCTCSGPVDAAIDATGRLKKAAVATAQTYSCLVASMVNLVVASDTGQNRNAVSYGGRSHRVRSVSPIETELVLLRGHRERIDRSPEDFHEPDACTAQLQLARTRGVTEAREVAGASRAWWRTDDEHESRGFAQRTNRDGRRGTSQVRSVVHPQLREISAVSRPAAPRRCTTQRRA